MTGEQFESLRDHLLRIEATVEPTAAPLDLHALQERGYSRDEAYSLLRRHGYQIPGGRRLRIGATVLAAIENGEVAP